MSWIGEVTKRYGLFRHHREEDTREGQDIVDQLDEKRNGWFGNFNKREVGANIEKKTPDKDVNQELDKSNGWFGNIKEKYGINVEENTGFDANRKVTKITVDNTAIAEKIDDNVNQNFVKKNGWYNNNDREDDADVEDKILDDFDEQFGKNYERADATNVEKNLDDNVIQELMKRNGDDTDMKEKPDEYVKTNRREDNTNVKEKTRDDVIQDLMQQNDMYMNNKKDGDTDVKEKDAKIS